VCRRLAENIDGHGDRDIIAYVISANIHRRHLTAEQKRELIANVLKVQPNVSDRAIANITKVDHKTVAPIRAEMEGRGEIPHVETRTDSKGRQQPVHKSKTTSPPRPATNVEKVSTSASKSTTSQVFHLRLVNAASGRSAHRPHVAVSVKQGLGCPILCQCTIDGGDSVDCGSVEQWHGAVFGRD
jgi:hypothetical protein